MSFNPKSEMSMVCVCVCHMNIFQSILPGTIKVKATTKQRQKNMTSNISIACSIESIGSERKKKEKEEVERHEKGRRRKEQKKNSVFISPLASTGLSMLIRMKLGIRMYIEIHVI